MLRALVTGGAGAIGSRLVQRLLAQGHQVVVLDDLSSGFIENIPKGAEFVSGSILDSAVLNALFNDEGYEYIFHLASLFANQNSVEHPERDLEVNGLGLLKLTEKTLQSTKRKKLKRLLYASSSCIYGGYSGSVAEDGAPRPSTPYAITKLLGEYYFRYYADHCKLPMTIVRLFNSYGPGERPGRYRNVIPNFIAEALRDEVITITGTGEETRDFTFVDDTVACILKAAFSRRSLGEVYNVGTGTETSIHTLASEIIRISGSRSEIRFAPRRSWDTTTRRCADISKAASHLSYEPKTSLQTGLSSTIDWLRSIDRERSSISAVTA